MARPREFDEDQVIELARNAFWAGGVAATSISDLSEATGLSVGSIYKAFGSKDRLCRRTLDDYLAQARDLTAAMLAEGETPIDGLRTWLDNAAARAADPSPTRGCYAVELAAELAATNEAIRSALVEHDVELRRMVADAVSAAVDAGELVGEPEALTRMITATVNGLQVEARKGISRGEADLIINTMIDSLRPPPG